MKKINYAVPQKLIFKKENKALPISRGADINHSIHQIKLYYGDDIRLLSSKLKRIKYTINNESVEPFQKKV